jgi:hypothetical protein
MGTAGRAESQDGNAVVVLVNCAGGRELEVVRDALVNSLNTPTLLISHANLAATAVSLDLATGLLDVDGRRVRPAVVWVRHSSAGAMVAHARPAGSMTPLNATSWSRLLGQVSASTIAALPGSTPVGPGQLVDAGRLGVKAPRTVVTTDVDAGVRQMRTPTVIVKTPDFRLFEPDPRNWSACFPVIVERDAVPGERDAVPGGRAGGGRPVVVQEYVAHARELRVYYLNGGLCAFEIGKPEPSSLWTDPAGVTVTRVDCPEDAEKAVRTLCAAWDLRYAAFDLLVSDTGELVFLEANPDGDWLWFERKARWHGVSFMAAVMVRELFVRGTSLGARADDSDRR